jgi:hypothetical protein
MQRARSGGQPEVPVIRGQGRPYRARPAQPLEPGRDRGVVKVPMAAAVAGELEQPV